MDHARIAEILGRALGRAAEPPSFLPLLDGIREALAEVGVHADRIQLPMTRDLGFRHPTLGLLLLTWAADQGYAGTESVSHSELDALPMHGVVGSPFEGIVLRGDAGLRLRLAEDDGGYPMLGQLRERGYRDYCSVGLPMPGGDPQPMSIATRGSFPADVAERVHALAPLLALAVYGAYRTSQAVRVAQAYIGQASGPRVLAGEIKRGSTQHLQAGIMFCDIRGFTALSERVGADEVVAVVNQVFAVVGEEAASRGGEILKFIGDAMLLVFPVDGDRAVVARAMVETASASLARLATSELPVGIGFGAHLGDVVQGNIGTPVRLDFTVMGPAVNLASRLEGLCKVLAAPAVFSAAVASRVEGLRPAGAQVLEGIAEPVEVWVLGAADPVGMVGVI